MAKSMKAVIYREFGGKVAVEDVPLPKIAPHGVLVRVCATGVCRSDWHGWQGHDPDIQLPHVPGHELAGIVEKVGSEVTRFRGGERVTVPFVSGCGSCRPCQEGQQQVCDHQRQPGFTHWGSFAEYVALDHADINVVHLPDQIDMATAASLGCRFATSFRAVVHQGKLKAGQWLAVHGCGGIGLSALMIGKALGAKVVAVDIHPGKLEFATELGADAVVNGREVENVGEAVSKLTDGGTHVSIDALGSNITCLNSIASLRKQGRHVQVGLMVDSDAATAIPMGTVMGNELEMIGSHGMQAHCYPQMLDMICEGKLCPQKLVGRVIRLDHAPDALTTMDKSTGAGVTIVEFPEKSRL